MHKKGKILLKRSIVSAMAIKNYSYEKKSLTPPPPHPRQEKICSPIKNGTFFAKESPTLVVKNWPLSYFPKKQPHPWQEKSLPPSYRKVARLWVTAGVRPSSYWNYSLKKIILIQLTLEEYRYISSSPSISGEYDDLRQTIEQSLFLLTSTCKKVPGATDTVCKRYFLVFWYHIFFQSFSMKKVWKILFTQSHIWNKFAKTGLWFSFLSTQSVIHRDSKFVRLPSPYFWAFPMMVPLFSQPPPD